MKTRSLGFAPTQGGNILSGLALLVSAFLALALPNGLRADVFNFGVLVGNGAALDHVDGTGTNARFFNPTSAAVDSSGNVYIADGGDHTVRKISGGVVTTLAGSSGQAGSSDGTGSNARFQYPYAVAVDSSGNVYVTDIGDHTVRRITPGGSVTTIAGTVGVTGSVDGQGTNALFNSPQGIAVDISGNVYVADTNNSTIRKITNTGAVSTFAGTATFTGSVDSVGTNARFNYPTGVAVDAVGNVYVADFANSTIRKITAGGSVSTFAGTAGSSGSADGAGSSARFDHPGSVAVDGAGTVYVIDTSSQTVRKIGAAGNVTTLAGAAGLPGNVDAFGTNAKFFYPFGIGVTASGSTVYVADTGNHTIRAVTSGGTVTTYAGASGLTGIADGVGGEALFRYPNGIAIDGSGNLYVADHDNNTIRKVTPSGAVTTFAGSAGLSGNVNGTGSGARFNGPTGVAIDSSSNVYVADAGNNSVRKISPGGTVSTFATGFANPQGIATDSANNVYVADTNNHVIRRITSTGTVTTFAGTVGQSGNTDGSGGSALFNAPYAIAVDGSSNLFVADFLNSTIRKITPTGVVTTFAGLAGKSGTADGNGTNARFNQTYGIAVSPTGKIFVTDTYNRAIRQIDSGGVVTTLNGTRSRFYYPQGIVADSAGSLYITDGDNQTVTKATLVTAPAGGGSVGSPSVTAGQSATFTISAAAGTNFQWQVSADNGATWTSLTDDGTYSGSTSATLTVSNTTTAMSGRQFRVQLSNAAGSSTSATGTLSVAAGNTGGSTGTARIVNLSVRTNAGTGDNSLFLGYAVGGSGSKQLVIRGIGPTLAQYAVTNPLADPKLVIAVANGGPIVASNTRWGGSATMANAFTSVGAFALPTNSADSAVVQAFASGTTYSVQISSNTSNSGIALAEIYDGESTSSSRLINASARAQVGTGDNVLIAGIVIGGTGTETVLIRGIGPTLAQYGVNGVLATPQLRVFNSSGAVIASNIKWGGTAELSTAFAKVGAFALAANSADCAMLVSLPPGNYSVQLDGTGGTTGAGLIELYEVP